MEINKRRVICIEMPGDVRNPEKAITALGGLKTIHKSATSSAQLQLSIGQWCAPLQAVSSQTSHILMKVKKNKRTGELTTETAGVVHRTFKFDSMADFQYLPPTSLLAQHSVDAEMAPDAPLYMPPPWFTKWSYQFPYRFEENTFTSRPGVIPDGSGAGAQGRRSAAPMAEAVLANPNWIPSHVMHFSDSEVPSEPPAGMMDQITAIEREALEVLKAMFEKRPCWIRAAIEEELPPHLRKTSRVQRPLMVLSNYWVDGPFRTAYTKLGYDPRKEPDAKKYQTIDFRDPYFRKTDYLVKDHEALGAQECHFRVPPANKSQMYMLCDFVDSTLKRLVNGSETLTVCDQQTGWMSKSALNALRQQMKVKSQNMRKIAASKDAAEKSATGGQQAPMRALVAPKAPARPKAAVAAKMAPKAAARSSSPQPKKTSRSPPSSRATSPDKKRARN